MTKAFKQLFARVVLLAALPMAALAASVRPLDLDNLVDNATTVFQGRCVDTRSERDAANGMIVTLTTFQVDEVLKGDVASVHTIKQIGGRIGYEVHRVDGMPAFTPGDEYVVFLYGVSSAGFSSPVGLAQGRFPVKAEGKVRVVGNGRDLREVLPPAARANLPESVQKRLDSAATEVEQMGLEEFKQLVRERARR